MVNNEEVSMRSMTVFMTTVLVCVALSAQAQNKPAEIVCTIRDSGTSLNCIWGGKEKKALTSDDVSAFIDQAAIFAYVTVKSKKGHERTFQPDANSLQFRRLSDLKKNGSVSEVSRAKLDLFSEIEKKVIKLSEELDAQASGADLVKFDASITTDKFRLEMKDQQAELESLRGAKTKLCTTTPQFEAVSKANASLQTTLSNIIVAFQTPGTCMEGFKVLKDRDGTVDLRQMDGIGKTFIENCKKR